MQLSRIEEKIDDIFGFVESCKMSALSPTKVLVPKNELYDLLDDLQREAPEEIKRCQKMLRQRDAILDDAEKKASGLLSDAQEQYKALVEEHAIMQEAYHQAELTVQQAHEEAEQIIANARAQAAEIGRGAIFYTEDLLSTAEKSIMAAYETSVNNARALQSHLELIQQNKAELSQDADENSEPEYEEPIQEEPAQDYEENEEE